jgi:hypothetical protein
MNIGIASRGTDSDVVVLSPVGLMEAGDDDLQNKVQQLLDRGISKIILDLEETKFENDKLHEVVRGFIAIYRMPGRKLVVGASKRNLDLLSITKTTGLFVAYDTVEEALTDFRKAA